MSELITLSNPWLGIGVLVAGLLVMLVVLRPGMTITRSGSVRAVARSAMRASRSWTLALRSSTSMVVSLSVSS